MASLRFEPANSQHSIEDFFLGIRFARQLSEGTYTRVLIAARQLAAVENLPAENQQASFLLTLDPVAGMQHGQTAPFGTFFQRFNASGGVEEELRVERNFIGYRTSRYDRWSDITSKLETLLLPLAKVYVSEVPLLDSAFLQYVDRFTASGQTAVNWSELFRSPTPWVVSGMIPTLTGWHSHCGRFEPLSDTQGARRLVNVNVDVGEPLIRPGAPTTNSLAILTLCTDQFAKPGVAPKVIDSSMFPSDMRSRFDAMHDRAKEILKELLSDDYIVRIGMKKASPAA